MNHVRATLLALFIASCKLGGSGSTNADAGAPAPSAVVVPKAASMAQPQGLQVLAELKKTAQCPSKTSPLHVWCLPADGWDTGTASAIPSGKHTWVGMGVWVPTGDSVGDALKQHVNLIAMSTSSATAGDITGRLTDITPDAGDFEQIKQVGDAIVDLTKVFKAESAKASLAKPLFDYVTTQLKTNATFTRMATGWSISGKGGAVREMRQSGPFWIAVETGAETGRAGVYVTMMTDRFDMKH